MARTNGGSLRKIGNKWYFSFEVGIIDGKRKRIEKVGGNTKKEAQEALTKALSEYNSKGEYSPVSDIFFSDFLDHWFNNYVALNCKYNTKMYYENIISRHLKPAFGIYRLKSITPQMLQNFINEKMINGFSRSSLEQFMNVIRSSFKYAVYPGGFIKENPSIFLKAPRMNNNDEKSNKASRVVLTLNQVNRILKHFKNSKFYIPILIGFHTGARIGEVTGLTWNDINLEKKTLTINKQIIFIEGKWCLCDTKTLGSNRTIKIGDTLVDALKNLKERHLSNKKYYENEYTSTFLEKQEIDDVVYNVICESKEFYPRDLGSQFVCCKENGELFTPNTIKYMSRVINYKLNIRFNFHSLRHTHATMLLEAGANIKDIQDRLGHTRVETTLEGVKSFL